MEAYEKGLITREDAGGVELKWEDGAAVAKMVEMIGKREGSGWLLGEGVMSQIWCSTTYPHSYRVVWRRTREDKGCYPITLRLDRRCQMYV